MVSAGVMWHRKQQAAIAAPTHVPGDVVEMVENPLATLRRTYGRNRVEHVQQNVVYAPPVGLPTEVPAYYSEIADRDEGNSVYYAEITDVGGGAAEYTAPSDVGVMYIVSGGSAAAAYAVPADVGAMYVASGGSAAAAYAVPADVGAVYAPSTHISSSNATAVAATGNPALTCSYHAKQCRSKQSSAATGPYCKAHSCRGCGGPKRSGSRRCAQCFGTEPDSAEGESNI